MEEFEKLFSQFKEEFDASPDEFYYIISKNWLSKWKANPNDKLPEINEDIGMISNSYLHY